MKGSVINLDYLKSRLWRRSVSYDLMLLQEIQKLVIVRIVVGTNRKVTSWHREEYGQTITESDKNTINQILCCRLHFLNRSKSLSERYLDAITFYRWKLSQIAETNEFGVRQQQDRAKNQAQYFYMHVLRRGQDH